MPWPPISGTTGACGSLARRVDDGSRAVAAQLARRLFGYRASEVAAALGYRGHGGVHTAVARVETGSPQLRQTAERLAKHLD